MRELSCPRKTTLALVCICFWVCASACQSNRTPLVNNTQKSPSTNDIHQSETRNHSIVVQAHVQNNGGTSTPIPIAHKTTSNAGTPFYFAMGSEASGDLTTPLVQQSPVKMLTSWYNGHNDLSWITSWHSSFIPSLYAKGDVLQLEDWSGGPKVNVNTRDGATCGSQYPLSSQFLQYMLRR